MLDKAQFETVLRETSPTDEQKKALADIAEKMRLTAMEQPWAYIKALQTSFDSSQIQYTEDMDDMDMNPAAQPAPPEWKVCFDGSFWGHHGRERAGRKFPLERRLSGQGGIG